MYADQIRGFELRRKTAIERQAAINELANSEGRSFEDEEKKEFDALDSEIVEIDEHIVRVKKLEARDAATAQQVKAPTSVSKGPTIMVRAGIDKDDEFKGQSFVRRVIARALAHLEGYERSAGQIAEHRWGQTHPQLVKVIKAGVPGGATTSGSWGAELVGIDNRYTADFLEFLYSLTVFDKLAATGYWVGEAKSIPVSAMDFSTVNLTPLKVGAMSVASNELLRDSSPSAEMLIRDGLGNASGQRIDTTFLGQAAAVAGVSPAGILNGLAPLGSNGSDGAAVRADLRELYAPFITAKVPTTGLVLVMHPNTAVSASLMANALGQDEFPDLGPDGGSLRRLQVVTGHNVGATHVILLKPSEIWKIGDSGIEVSISREATIEQDSVPLGDSENPTASSATMMSMFGTESTAFKVVRSINFAKRRASAVSWLEDAPWGNAAGVTT
jgi:hypothetical protein